MSTDPTIRSPRGRHGATASLLALLGLLLSAFAAVEAVSLAAHHRTLWFATSSVGSYGARTQLDAPAVRIVGIAAVALGLLLILRAALPARRGLIELRAERPGLATGLTRPGLRRTLSSAATGVDGISTATTRTRRRHVSISANTELRDVTGLQDRVQDAVTARLADLDPVRVRPVRVTLHRKDR